MAALRSKFYTVLETILAADVADAGTTTISYPSGTAQGDFSYGLADLTNTYLVLNKNDKILYGTSGVYIGISFGASNITITNHSGYTWVAGTRVDLNIGAKKGNRRLLQIQLPPLSTITAADIITAMQPGMEGDLEYAEFVTTIAATTGSKLATLGFKTGANAVTGMTLGLTSATVTPKGVVLPFGLPTANYTLARATSLSVVGSAVTAFVEGEGYINLYVRPAADDIY